MLWGLLEGGFGKLPLFGPPIPDIIFSILVDCLKPADDYWDCELFYTTGACFGGAL